MEKYGWPYESSNISKPLWSIFHNSLRDGINNETYGEELNILPIQKTIQQWQFG